MSAPPVGPQSLQKQAPRYTDEAVNRLTEISERFKKDLQQIAQSASNHDANGESIHSRHIDSAFQCLAKLGLNKRTWRERPEFEVGVGTGLVAGASTLSDYVDHIFAKTASTETIETALFIALGLIGSYIAIAGWSKGSGEF